MTIRQLNWQSDYSGLRVCLVELQDAERAMDPRMPSGESIADEYLGVLKQDCERFHGQVFVVDIDQEIAAYICIHSRYRSGCLDEAPSEYGYVSDLVVRRPWRGRGYAKVLIETAEKFARERQVRWLRIGVLASNTPALELYHGQGFKEYELQLEKPLD